MSLRLILLTFTLMPVFVASLTAASRLSYFGLNETVNAQSMILPGMNKIRKAHYNNITVTTTESLN